MKTPGFILALLAGSVLLAGTPAPIPAPVEKISAEARAAALGDFIAALAEEPPMVRAKMLVDVAAADPEHSEIPLAYLLSALDSPETAKAVANRFFQVWKDNPANLDFAVCGARIAALCEAGRTPEFEPLASAVLRKPPGGDPRQIRLYRCVAAQYFCQMLAAGRFSGGTTFAGQIGTESRLLIADLILGFCEMGRFTDLVKGETALQYVRMQKQIADELAAADGAVVKLDDLKKRIELYLQVKHPERARQLLCGYTERYGARPELFSTRLLVAVRTGDLALLDELLQGPLRNGKKYYVERIAFDCCINARAWERAESYLKQITPAEDAVKERLRLELARRDYRKAAEVIRSNAALLEEPAQLMLSCAEKLRDPQLYAEAKKMIAGDPGADPQLANALGYVAAVLNIELEEAHRLVSAALAREPASPAYLDSMAWVLYRQGKLPEARAMIRKALADVRLLPLSGTEEILDHAGDIELASGDRKAAREYYRRALSLATGDDFVDPAAIRAKKDKIDQLEKAAQQEAEE